MLNHPIKPMLLHKSAGVPADDRFIHQLKFDGHRAIVHYDSGKVKIFTRQEKECTLQYPELHDLRLEADSCILDGEMIVMGPDAKPCFESVMERFQAKNGSIARLANRIPAHYVAFDILYLNGKSVMDLPLERRLELLNQVVRKNDALSACPTVEDGEQLLEAARHNGLEGIVSKNRFSLYKPNTRSSQWLKIKNYLYDIVQISAISKKQFGWVLTKDGKYVGVTELVPPTERQAFWGIVKQLVKSEDKNFIYLDPVISCRVKFQSYTRNGLMRSPAVMGFVMESPSKPD